MPNPLDGVPSDVVDQLGDLNTTLDRRASNHRILEAYAEGKSPLPQAVQRAQVTRAYRMLMGMSDAPWGSLVVESTSDRLEVVGLQDEDQDAADTCWDLWQTNSMDLESKVAHTSILVDGRASALVWREPGSDHPEVSLDNMGTTAVKFKEGSRRNREAALRRWKDGSKPYCAVYRKDGIFKFRGPKNSSGSAGTQWEPWQPSGEDWPVSNPYKVVPVVELGINRRLRAGAYPYARGEYEHCTGLIDRINMLTFLGLVVAFWMGFPLRGVIGERILTDDNGDPIAPFDAHASGLFQLENKDAKIVEYSAADRGNLSVFEELDHLSSITKTPRHYFPMKGGMQNLSADAIRASEGSLHAKVSDHKPSIGEGWEETCRLMGMMSDDEVDLSAKAQLKWADHESRSLAERADAAGKLSGIIPQIAIAEKVLGFTQDEWRRWEAQANASQLGEIVRAATAPPPAPPGSPAAPAAPAPANGGPPVAVPAR